MEFEPNRIYHLFNQGNNRQQVFFEEANYLYFLTKVRKHILPHADILCYCLMPNHFHFLIVPREAAVELSKSVKPKHRRADMASPPNEGEGAYFQKKLNASIGTLLSSYTKAINKRYDRSGSLFRRHTKAKDGWTEDVITEGGTKRHLLFSPDNDYATRCYHYIHENPVKAGLVRRAIDWRYSSARDYGGLRKGTLCNQSLAHKLLHLTK